MKVNVTGRGAIAGIGILPARGVDLNENSIRRLLNMNGVKVYSATTGELITPRYFMKAKPPAKKTAKPAETPAPVVASAVVPKSEVPVEPVPEEPKFEVPTLTPYLTPEVAVEETAPAVEPEEIVDVPEEEITTFTEEQEAPAIEESLEAVDVIEETPAEETPVEETKEEKPYYGKKKKNRR